MTENFTWIISILNFSLNEYGKETLTDFVSFSIKNNNKNQNLLNIIKNSIERNFLSDLNDPETYSFRIEEIQKILIKLDQISLEDLSVGINRIDPNTTILVSFGEDYV